MNYEGDSRLQHIHVDLQAGPLLPAGRHKPRTASFGRAKAIRIAKLRNGNFCSGPKNGPFTAGARLYHVDLIAVKLFLRDYRKLSPAPGLIFGLTAA